MKIGLTITTTLVSLATALGQGTLAPSGAPAPTMKSLSEIECRTPIRSAPFTISSPGSYYLTTNLTVTSGSAILITTHNVSLDLNGFSISSTASPASGNAIGLTGGPANILIRNGNIVSGTTNNGGIYGGPGFQSGIDYNTGALANVQVKDVNVKGVGSYGIYLGNYGVVERCAVKTCGAYGIAAASVKNSLALDCGNAGITGLAIEGCRGECTIGTGIWANVAANSTGMSYSSSGVYANVVQCCQGISNTGTGIYGVVTENSYGTSSSGTGIVGTSLINSYGYSTTGTGIAGELATSCVAYGLTRAMNLHTANGCRTLGGTNLLSFKFNMP